eukprot:388610_1
MAQFNFFWRACVGLALCACMIGGNVIDLVIADYLDWILVNEKNCLYNSMVELDDTWIVALRYVAYIGMLTVIILYGLILLGYFELVLCFGCFWFLVYIANDILSDWLSSTYIRSYYYTEHGWWGTRSFVEYGDDCKAEYFGEMYGLMIGSNILPVIGICCLCFLCAGLATIRSNNDDQTGTHQPLPQNEEQTEEQSEDSAVSDLEVAQQEV